jgi:hypothetical protein
MGERESKKSNRGRRTGGGGSAGGGTGASKIGGGSAGGSSLTRMTGGTKGKEDTIREVGISDVGGGPLHTDTMGAKVWRGHGHPKTEPAGSPLEKTSRIHDPLTIEQGKGKKPEYDPPQRIEEDRTLVNPD